MTATETPKYVPEPFPELLYDHKKRTTKVVANEEEKKKALGEGFEEDPFSMSFPPQLETQELAKKLERIVGELAQVSKALEAYDPVAAVQQADTPKKPAAGGAGAKPPQHSK